MQIKSPISIWERETYLQNFDFAIIGNGFTGMQVALQIRKKYHGATIAVIDKGYISDGASMRNAGFACFGSVSEIIDDIAGQDETTVYDLVKMRFQGLQNLENDFGKKAIDYRTGNAQEVFLSSEKLQYETCLDTLEGVNKKMKPITGLGTTYKAINRSKTFGNLNSFMPQSIVNELEGYLHTGKLYHEMQKQVIAADIFWVNNFEVDSFTAVNQKWCIKSKCEREIWANQVISCVNAYTPLLIKNADLTPARGQIIVTEPLKNQPLTGIFHADKGYIYARPLDNRILIGGARNLDFEAENTHEFAENTKITEALLDFVNKNLLSEEETKIAYKWSCIMAMSPRKGGLPIIKEEKPNLWLCYRLGGMGLALSSVVSRKMAAML